MINSTKYFSWGDIRGQNKNGSGSYSFSLDNYNAGKCGKGHTLSKNITQGNTTYDAARVNIGSPWKMFTQTQGQELIKNTTNSWRTINGVNGRKFTSKSDSTKYIFLPAGGYWINASYYSYGSEGIYWSTILYDSNKAIDMDFNSGDINAVNISDKTNRYYGASIRAIQ